MNAFEFESTHGADWASLERLIDTPERQLDADELLRLYRSACEQLALARARGYPTGLIDRLAHLTARAHQVVYRQSDFGLRRVRHLLLVAFPLTVRAHRAYVALAAALFLVPTVLVGLAVDHRPELVLSVVDSRTAEQYARMYSPDNPAIGRQRDAGSNWLMFGFYIKNNIGIAFQCYVTGIVFGLGSLFFLLYNGAIGGAVAGYVSAQGEAGTFFPFIATHSAFELTAIVLAGAAGLRLGHAALLPGRRSRTAALAEAARATSVIIAGAGAMLVIAACLEAFWSSAAWVTPTAKFSMAACCWTLVGFFFLRRPHAA